MPVAAHNHDRAKPQQSVHSSLVRCEIAFLCLDTSRRAGGAHRSDTSEYGMGELAKLYEAHRGKVSDKWSAYLEAYETLFDSYRNRPVRILEIGVQNGGSLEIWSKFFPQAERIIGCDINPLCAGLTYEDPRISVIVGDANDAETTARIEELCESFDIIIDDGSRRSDDIVRSFALYFPKLANGGIFVAEDLHCSYWESYEGGIEAPFSSISFFKRLADYVNREHWGVSVPSEDAVSFFAEHWQARFDPSALEAIAEVRFRNSLAVVFKGSTTDNQLGARIVAGQSALANDAVVEMGSMRSIAPDQSRNAFGPLSPRLEEAVQDNDRTRILEKRAEAQSAKIDLLETQTLHLQEIIRETEISLRNCEASLAEANSQRHDDALQIKAARDQLDASNVELARARRHPLGNLGKYVHFKLLSGLSSKNSPLPSRMKNRFRRSAQKRDPKRSLLSLSSPEEMHAAIARRSVSYEGHAKAVATRPHTLIVSHDASRTGAPILALNLVQALAERYNVTTLCLGGGELIDSFRTHSVAVWVADSPSGNTPYFSALLDDMMSDGKFVFAIVNSIASRFVLGALRAHGVVNVALLHEFASNTLPNTAFSETFRAANQIVFSTELTLSNALATTGQARTPKVHSVPQGKCEVPRPNQSDKQGEAERDRLTKLLRPVGAEPDRFVVIGAGYVHFRKGVDLFIDSARRVLAQPDGQRAFFAWIGAGYSPDTDGTYSVYLRDQLERAGLSERVVMIPETSEIEHVYSLSNLFLLSSRLDPLPNVAIDAMMSGLPVVCFDNTSGIADVLSRADVRDECVADYLDTAGVADRIVKLMHSPEAYGRVQALSRAYAADTFDFARYAARIEQLALSERAAVKFRESDVAQIAKSGSLRPDFMLPPNAKRMGANEAARYYVFDNWSQDIPRRPEPGFHPLLYWNALAEQSDFNGDAYAEFLRRNRPQGPWLTQVIRETDACEAQLGSGALTTALHIHAHNSDELSKIVERLDANDRQPDLYVSVTDRGGAEKARAELKAYRGKVRAIRVVASRGRGIGPLLTEFGPELIRDYDIIGHVHTNKSEVLADHSPVDRWAHFLYENMIGGERAGPMIDRIISAFAANEKLGIVYPEDPNLLSWSSNEPITRGLASRLGIQSLPETFFSSVGTMFWIRKQALAPFVKLGLDWDDYPKEAVAKDGTLLAALERLFGVVPANLGLSVAVTNITGLTR